MLNVSIMTRFQRPGATRIPRTRSGGGSSLICGGLLLGGRVADFMGRKRIFVVGLSGFGLASALGGVAGDAVTFTEVPGRARASGVWVI